MSIPETTPLQARERQRQGALLIDIRDAHERVSGQAEGALAIGRDELESEPARHLPDPGAEILLICQLGKRSQAAAAVLDASRSTWREVELLGSRLGALDLYDAEIRSTRIVGSRIGWFNLRGSTLEDVVLEDCTLEELDLSGATATRVRLRGCRVDSLLLAGARLQDVDLRGLEVGSIANLEALAGATLDAEQVAALATAFASHLGIRVEG